MSKTKMDLKFPNYMDSLTVEECFAILKVNELDLDITVEESATSPSFVINRVEHKVWSKVIDLLGGSGQYDSRRMKGLVFNFGRYFSPIRTLKEMEKNRTDYLLKLNSQKKSP